MREADYYDKFLFWLDYYDHYRVEGDSMLPTLKNGEEVLVRKLDFYKIGDIVVANHPFRITPIIKRITEFSTGGKLFLSGDNPDESTDSRTFGEIAEKDVLGKVICRLR
jgi:nickel-type superoxide dismutase maturation protease